MKKNLLLLFFSVSVLSLNAQNTENQKLVGDVDPNIFIDNITPSDFPQRTLNMTNEVYFKVVQGYINVNPSKINISEAKRYGYTVPTNSAAENELNHEKYKRKEPVSEEDKRLHQEKQKQLK